MATELPGRHGRQKSPAGSADRGRDVGWSGLRLDRGVAHGKPWAPVRQKTGSASPAGQVVKPSVCRLFPKDHPDCWAAHPLPMMGQLHAATSVPDPP